MLCRFHLLIDTLWFAWEKKRRGLDSNDDGGVELGSTKPRLLRLLILENGTFSRSLDLQTTLDGRERLSAGPLGVGPDEPDGLPDVAEVGQTSVTLRDQRERFQDQGVMSGLRGLP